MAIKANDVLKVLQSWIGKKESDGSFKSIIDLYNTQKPLPRGYKVKYTDEWCAPCMTAAFHALKATNIMFPECSCQKMIEGSKKMGIWFEDESITPKAGDLILYDWQDNGVGDDTGWADHIGMVEKVSNGVITVIEGNNNASVKRRTIKVNAKYIRGYIRPKYAAATNTKYKLTGNVNIRKGAGTNYGIIKVARKGETVEVSKITSNNWGYVSAVKGYISLNTKYTVKV